MSNKSKENFIDMSTILDKKTILDINQKYIREVSKRLMLKKHMDQIRELNIFIIRINLSLWKQR